MYKEKISKKVSNVTVLINYIVFQEEDSFIGFCPSLNLSTYGDSVEDTKEAMKEVIQFNIQDWIEERRLEKELLRLGWQLQFRPVPLFRQPEDIGVLPSVIKKHDGIKAIEKTPITIPVN